MSPISATEDKKKQSSGKLIGLAIFLMISQPLLFIPMAIFGGIIFLVIKAITHQPSAPKQTRQETFDDCPQKLFCFHKDKGEHHVRKGKEIDPWDRPDIDISKYQRQR